jgi:AraC family transcriptional regulator
VRVTYRSIRPLAVAYARGIGPYEAASREAWATIARWLDQRQARKRVKQAYGFFRDNPRTTAPELLRYDACIPVTAEFDSDPDAGIGRQTLPGGAFAVHTHVGSYADVGELFSQLHSDIVPKRGLFVDYDRPFVAVYLNDPLLTRGAHRRTELCIPVLPIQMPHSSNDDAEVYGRMQAVG